MGSDFVVARTTARRAARSGLVWGAAFSVYLAASALGYTTTYKTAGERRALAATLGSNPGIGAIFGPARGLDTVAGFTEWRAVGVLNLVAAVWGLLLGTRLLRGEEDAGRWELLLAGRTTRSRAAAEALGGLAVGFAVLWSLPAAVLAAVGRSGSVRFAVGDAFVLVLASVSAAAVFLAVGALAGQLAPTRRHAAAAAGGALALAYALRAVADAGAGLGGMRWLTPLGWAEQLRPLTGLRRWPLVPLTASVALLAAAAVLAAGRRDLGGSFIPDRSRARPATRLLGGVLGLTIRLVRPVAIGWLLAVTVAGMLFGLVAKSAARAVQGSAAVREELARIGAQGVGARAYLGVAFLIVAVLVCLAAAAAIAGLRNEEGEGRLDHLLARPSGRTSWVFGRIGVGAALVTACAAVAACAAWAGAASQDAGVGFGRLQEAGANVVPPALLVLGVGVLVFGMRPRAASAACYGLVAWSFLVLLVGTVVRANHWLLDTSIFRHMTGAPAVPPDWTADAIMTALAIVAAGAGVALFRRRDLVGE